VSKFYENILFAILWQLSGHRDGSHSPSESTVKLWTKLKHPVFIDAVNEDGVFQFCPRATNRLKLYLIISPIIFDVGGNKRQKLIRRWDSERERFTTTSYMQA